MHNQSVHASIERNIYSYIFYGTENSNIILNVFNCIFRAISIIELYKMVGALPIRIVKSNVSSVGPSSERIMGLSLWRSTYTLETLDSTIRIGSAPTILYFDLYLNTAYAAHYVYLTRTQICGACLFTRSLYVCWNIFIKSLLIHEENTKENHKRIVSWYRGKELP